VLNVLDQVDEVCELIEALTKSKGIYWVIDVEESLTVDADTRAVYAILRNSITNSFKYSKKNGTIWINDKEQNLVLIIV
jgi:signal transduction histidine kinase